MCGECNWPMNDKWHKSSEKVPSHRKTTEIIENFKKMKNKSRTNLVIENGLTIEIIGMSIEKYQELIMLIEANSDEKIYVNGIGHFSPKDIVKISRNE